MDDNQEFSAEEILNFVNGNKEGNKQEEKKPIASKIINISVKVAFSRSGIKLKIENEKDDNSKEESKYEKILRLNELKNKNIITEDEFEQEKSKLLKGD